MDPGKAVANLQEISAQIQEVVMWTGDGEVVASSLADSGRAETMAKAAARLLDVAGKIGSEEGALPVVQLEAATEEGSVVVVREGDQAIAATTGPEPTIGLVLYDLRTCLRGIAAEEEKPEPKPKPRAPRRKKAESKDSGAAA